jgi:hypothetical protein
MWIFPFLRAFLTVEQRRVMKSDMANRFGRRACGYIYIYFQLTFGDFGLVVFPRTYQMGGILVNDGGAYPAGLLNPAVDISLLGSSEIATSSNHEGSKWVFHPEG